MSSTEADFASLDNLTASLIALFLSILIYWLGINWRYYKSLPPGPWGLPIIGHLAQIGARPYLTFAKWADEYGPIFGIRMGSRLTFVISGNIATKEALVGQAEDFAGRPNFYSFSQIANGKSLTFSQYGPHWKHHKAAARTGLSLFTKKRVHQLETQVIDEADTIIKEFRESSQPLDPERNIHVATSAIVYSISFDDGSNIRENQGFLDLLRNTDELNRLGAGKNIADVMPWTLPFVKHKFRKFQRLFKKYRKIREETENRLRIGYQQNEPRNIRDAVEDLLTEMGEEKLLDVGLDPLNLKSLVGDVLFAGQATVSTLLRWALLYMVEYPDIQKRVQNEIDNNLGRDITPSYEKRSALPYCEAVLLESLRFSVFLPFLLPHSITRDCKFRDYYLPRGSLVFFNVWSINMDPLLWEKPHIFYPERFLEKDTGQIDRNKAEMVIAFGMGKRRCLGEFLGRLEIFLFFVRLFQQCSFSKDENEHYTLEGEYGISLEPRPYKINMNMR